MNPMDPHPVLGIDTSKPSPARVYDYLLGGKDNYPADRRTAEDIVSRWPFLRTSALHNRAFAVRAVHHLARETGVTQFIDLGSGLPTVDNVHEVAQRLNSDARIVYIDNDPIVLAHGRALLRDAPNTIYHEADVRDAQVVLQQASEFLDLSLPVAVLCTSVLTYVPEDPAAVMAPYVQAMAPGSYLVIAHNTSDGTPTELLDEIRESFREGMHPRPAAQLRAIFDGLDFVPPGLVDILRWKPDRHEDPVPMTILGAVARTP